MDLLQAFDVSHFAGSTGVAGAIIYVAVKVIKPLLESFLKKMPDAINQNTAAVKELIEQQNRSSGYTREEHSEIAAHLKILTDSLLTLNGVNPTNLPPTTQPETPLTTKHSDTVSKAEFDGLRDDLNRVLAHLRGE